jgi:hypothetical protein
MLKNKVHNLMVDCINQVRLEDETINYVNDEGFTPFLYYIKEFTNVRNEILSVI